MLKFLAALLMLIMLTPSLVCAMPVCLDIFENAQDDTHNMMIDAAPKGVDGMIMSPTSEQESQTWSYTFTKEGTYSFHRHPHQAFGMKGTIIVGTALKPENMHKMKHERGE